MDFLSFFMGFLPLPAGILLAPDKAEEEDVWSDKDKMTEEGGFCLGCLLLHEAEVL